MAKSNQMENPLIQDFPSQKSFHSSISEGHSSLISPVGSPMGMPLEDDRPPITLEEAYTRTLVRKDVAELLLLTKDFSRMDLRKANLTKMDLAGINFSKSNCSYVNFKDCNLEGANFSESSLWNANLEGANLTKANLQDADLDYTKLRGAILFRANIRRTTLPIDLIPRDEILRSVNEGTRVSR